MSKFSVQIMPKDKNFLKCFVAEPGHKLLYTDIASLEPHVLAHFSRDSGLMSLYGPNANPNGCIYLHVGSAISVWKENILKYYTPGNPTAEGTAAAKKYAKAERTAVKPAYLGWMYGLGSGTMHESTGIPVEECKQILQEIDAAFPGVVDFNARLKKEWTENGGWIKQEWIEDEITGRNRPIFIDGRPGYILNGRGRPIGVAPDKVKDLGNRFVQSTGHDVLLQLLVYINKLRKQQGVDMRPYNVDVHDATIWQVADRDVEKAVAIFHKSYTMLNETLKWSVVIKGDVVIGNNLAEFLE